MQRRIISLIAVALMTVAFAAPATAQGRPDGVGGGSPPPGVGDTGLYNNLSVPAVLVNGPALVAAPTLSLGCTDAQAPGADGAPTDDVYTGYWLQKSEATWTAACSTADTASVEIDWGDNLTGTTALKSGKTIRVEAGLLAAAAPEATGYVVEKLNDVLDRYADYGTKDELGTLMTVRVWDPGAMLTIEQIDDEGAVVSTAVPTGPAVAEINSMGAIVYGFNWGQKGAAPLPGTYRITFDVSSGTTITDVIDETGATAVSPDGHSATLEITLTASGGKNRK